MAKVANAKVVKKAAALKMVKSKQGRIQKTKIKSKAVSVPTAVLNGGVGDAQVKVTKKIKKIATKVSAEKPVVAEGRLQTSPVKKTMSPETKVKRIKKAKKVQSSTPDGSSIQQTLKKKVKKLKATINAASDEVSAENDTDKATEKLSGRWNAIKRVQQQLSEKKLSLAKMDVDDDSDSDDNDEKDNAACKAYKDDFGFEKSESEIKPQEAEIESDEEKETKTKKAKKQVPDHNSPEEMDRTLYVGNVSLKTDKFTLSRLFSQYGKVDSVRFRSIPVADNNKYKLKQILDKDFNRKRSSMAAYVKFVEPANCVKGLEANMTVLDGHHLLINPCMRKDAAKMRQDLSEGRTIFIGNLPNHTEEEAMYELFKSCGEIVSINVIRSSTVCKGTAFITFKGKESVPKAIKKDGTTYLQRAMRISKAVRKIKTGSIQKKAHHGQVRGKKPFNKDHSRQNTVANKGPKKPFVAKGTKPEQVASILKKSKPKKKVAAKTTDSAAPTAKTFTGEKNDRTKKSAAAGNKKLNKHERKKLILAKKLNPSKLKSKSK